MTTVPVTRAQTFYAQDMKPVLAQQLVARQLFGHRIDIPFGKTKFEYDSVSDLQNAVISVSVPDGDGPWDSLKITGNDLQLAYITEKWKIDRDKYDAFLTEGKNLPVASNRAAAQAIGVSEEKLLAQSWKPDGSSSKIYGLYGCAGNTMSTDYQFDIYGNAKKALAAMFKMLSDDKVPVSALNFNLTLNPQEYYQLTCSESTNGAPEMPMVEKMLNKVGGAPGRIRESPEIVAGTALLSPVDTAGTYIDLVVAKDPTVTLGEDSKLKELSPIYATTYEILAPVVYQPNALCIATSI